MGHEKYLAPYEKVTIYFYFVASQNYGQDDII